MTAEEKQTGDDIASGLEWAKRSLVCSLIGFLIGAGFVSGALLLIAGVFAVAFGFIGLRRLPKSRSVWHAKSMAVGGIVLGCFLTLVGLDALLVPDRAITNAKKSTSLATATALESAINSIFTEYGKIPDVGNHVTTNSPAGLKLLNILLGLDDKSDSALNDRGIKFLSVKEGKKNKNGLIYAPDGKSIEGLYDPWGNPYTVELDVENRGNLDFTRGSRPVHLKGRRVTAYSPGPDHKLGTSDDVVTW